MMNKDSKIAVLGHRGMVGSAVVRQLSGMGYENIIDSGNTDLREQQLVRDWFKLNKPEYIFFTAGKVGGIRANNTFRAEFIYDNASMALNVINSAHRTGVKKMVYVASSCAYPADCPKPIKEEYLLTGELEKTNEPYAIAKIAGIKMCENYRKQYGDDFICAMPTNSYGINDKYDLKNSHVLPAILRQVIQAKKNGIKEIELWGTGKPRREFIYVDDMAEAIIFLMNHSSEENIVNVGTGSDVSIKMLAELIKEIVGWEGSFTFNGFMDGMYEKRLDVSKINNMGWCSKTTLVEGLRKTLNHIYENKIDETW